MDPDTLKYGGLIVGGGLITALGNVIIKIILQWSGWKKEKDKTTQEELYTMIAELKRDRDAERVEIRKGFQEERTKTEKEVAALREENRLYKERELHSARRIARMEVLIDSLIDRIKQSDPNFSLKFDPSGEHTPLPGEKH